MAELRLEEHRQPGQQRSRHRQTAQNILPRQNAHRLAKPLRRPPQDRNGNEHESARGDTLRYGNWPLRCPIAER
eukprot:3664947-Lingulodinium_polyedra.AAC.1